MSTSKRELISQRAQQVQLSGIRRIFEMVLKKEGVVRLELGEPDFDTPPFIKEAAKKALDDNFTHYTTTAGMIELREIIAQKLKRENGITVDPQNSVAITNGAANAIYLSLLTTLNPGDEVLLPNPGYSPYYEAIRLAGGVPTTYPLLEEKQFGIDLELLEKAISPRTRIIIINSPANPTGTVLSLEELKGIAKLAIKYDLLIISDEVYERIIYDGNKHYSIGSLPDVADRVITINSFSKTYAMTGWRVGYAAARKEIIEQIFKLQLYVNTCVNSIGQKAAITACQGGEEDIARMVTEYKERRDLLVSGLNSIEGVECLKPKGAFYVFPNITKLGRSSEETAMFLIDKANVATIPGSAFGSRGEGYLRMSFANSKENLEKAVERIGKALQR